MIFERVFKCRRCGKVLYVGKIDSLKHPFIDGNGLMQHFCKAAKVESGIADQIGWNKISTEEPIVE